MIEANTAAASSETRSTFRTLQEVLTEITQLVSASAEALRDLESSDRLNQRDSMLVQALIQSRDFVADSLAASCKSASEPITERWLQYDPVGELGWNHLSEVRQATSGEQAACRIAEFDKELHQRVECLRLPDTHQDELWQQVLTLLELCRRATTQIQQSAQQL